MKHVFSYWPAGAGADCAPLDGTVDAEVVVIGAGMAGLGTAHQLLRVRPGLDLVLLEARHAGFGASGRNAGIVETPISMPIWLFDGALPARESLWALATLRRRIDEAVRCLDAMGGEGQTSGSETAPQIRPTRVEVVATSRLAREALTHARRRLDDAGIPAGWTPAVEAATFGGRRGQGVLTLDGFTLDPAAGVRRLAASVRASGARVYEGTRCTRLVCSGPGKVEVETEGGGRVRARVAIDCSGSWSQPPAGKRFRLHLYQTYMVASERLDDAAIAALGGEACTVSEFPAMTYRRVHDRRLLFGGLAARVRQPEPSAEFDRERVRQLTKAVRHGLPELRDLAFELSWGGCISFTRRGAPSVGPDEATPGVFRSVGHHGLMPAFLSGSMLQGLVLGASEVDDEAERLRRAYDSTHLRILTAATTALRWWARSLAH